MNSLQRQTVSDFCVAVVGGIRPDEVPSVPLLIEVFDGAPESGFEQPAAGANEFGLGLDLESASAAVHIVGATMALAHTYLSARALRQERESTQRLHADWSRLLTKYGLDPELAKAIPLSHAADLAVVLERLNQGGGAPPVSN
ncbi:MAG: hypothetical protein ABI824_15960 [Acidobacteriota bacterium]